jgi:hypothetical protein
MSINDFINKKIKHMQNGKVFVANDLSNDLDTRNAVEKTLSRLSSSKIIDRVDRGIYQKPKLIKPYNIKAVATTKDILDAKSKLTGATFALTGASALYQLGLTTQVPAKDIYLSDKRLSDVKIGKKTISFKYVDHNKTDGENSKYNLIFNALEYLGKNELTNDMINKIATNLTSKEISQLQKNMIHRKIWIQKVCHQIIKKATTHV